jgi:hypothetical protein
MRIAGYQLYTVVVIKIKTGRALQQCPPCFLSKEFPPVGLGKTLIAAGIASFYIYSAMIVIAE